LRREQTEQQERKDESRLRAIYFARNHVWAIWGALLGVAIANPNLLSIAACVGILFLLVVIDLVWYRCSLGSQEKRVERRPLCKAYHSVRGVVHHTNPNCLAGRRISKHNKRSGTGGKPECKQCRENRALPSPDSS